MIKVKVQTLRIGNCRSGKIILAVNVFNDQKDNNSRADQKGANGQKSQRGQILDN